MLLASKQETRNGKLNFVTGNTRAIKGLLLEVKENAYGTNQWVQRIVDCFIVNTVCLHKGIMQL